MSIVEVTVLSRKSEPEPVWEAVSFPRWDDNVVPYSRSHVAVVRVPGLAPYLLSTTCGAGLLAASAALTRWILLRDRSVELFLLLRDRCFLLLDLAMLLEEFVQQHRVHRFVADGVRLAVVIARDQVRIHFLDLLGDEAELREAIGVELFLIKECDRF